MIGRMVIFGASGDLTARYLAPALARLGEAGRLPNDFTVLGVSREDWDAEAFRRHQAHRLGRHAADVDPAARAALANAAGLRAIRHAALAQPLQGGSVWRTGIRLP